MSGGEKSAEGWWGGGQDMDDVPVRQDRKPELGEPKSLVLAELSKELPTDMSNQTPILMFLSLYISLSVCVCVSLPPLPCWLMSPPDSIEAIRQ